MTRWYSLAALGLVTTAFACTAPTDSDEESGESADALSHELAARAGEPAPIAILHLDDPKSARSFRDTAGSALACEANCPTAQSLGLFGSPNTGAHMDAIELSNPAQRSGVVDTVSLKYRQCLAYPAAKTHALGDDFSFSGWFLLRATPRPGYASIFSRWDAKSGGARQYDIALKTKKSSGTSTVYASFRKVLPNGQEVEALGQALYASNDAAAIKRFQNQWHHLVVRGSKAGGQADVEIAVDGVVNTSRVAAGIQTTSVTTHVGCNVNSDNPKGDITTAGGDPYESFDGKLDEITVYGGHISDRLVAALHEQSKPATQSFGYLVGAPREASDDKVIAVDPLLDRLKELNATRYALEVKGVGDLSQARRVLSAIEARIATNHDAAFWRNFRLLVDGRVQNYGGLRENLVGLGQGLVAMKHEHPNTFAGFKIDDFSTVARTDSSMANPDRLAMLCDETMKEPTLSLEPVVYCDSGSDPTLKQYGGGSWSKKGATKDHAMFRDIQHYLQSEYQNGKYARCLSGVTMYISPDDSGPDRPTYVDDNAAKLNGCLGTLRETGLPITEGIYSSSTASTSVPETTRLKNLEAARRTTPNAFEAFTLPSLDGSAMTRALQSAYGDPAHFIRW